MTSKDKEWNADSAKKRLSIKEWDEADRPREKLMNLGRQSLSNAELLAIIIGSGNAKMSAVDLAKEILASVNNSLHELSKLSYMDFCKRFDGIGPAKALNIVAALELGFRRKSAEVLQKEKIASSYDAYLTVAHLMSDLSFETFWIILLDVRGKIIKILCMSEGGLTETAVDVRRIFKSALEYGAVSLILAHNHPSGDTDPSSSDINTTKKIYQAGKLLTINVLDHIIVGQDTYYSFMDNGDMRGM